MDEATDIYLQKSKQTVFKKTETELTCENFHGFSNLKSHICYLVEFCRHIARFVWVAKIRSACKIQYKCNHESLNYKNIANQIYCSKFV